MNTLSIATIAGCGLILLIILILIVKKPVFWHGLLKDQSTLPEVQRPYSLSRTLACFWTVIIFFGLCYVGIVTGTLPAIDGNTLLLMGIATGTATVARLIDNSQAANPKLQRPQNSATAGFLMDILSDAQGITVSRLQAVCFNIVYGCLFISVLFTEHKFYPFDAKTLALLGVSSGAYAFMKIPEAS